MKIDALHNWDVSPPDAAAIQERLRSKVVLRDMLGTVRRIAGVDAAYAEGSTRVWAGTAILDYPSLRVAEEKWAEGHAAFPYMAGLLSFRELPWILKSLVQVEQEPDLILCDAHGIAHPRGVGLASHLGILSGKPTIGCAKNPLVGRSAQVGPRRGDYEFLRHRGRKVGAVLTTRSGTKPLFVSPGYGVTILGAVEWVLRCGGGHREPEPLRAAHMLVNRLRRQEAAQ